jgi:uncharacterized protein YpmB
MADEDKNFKLTPDYFKVGSILEHPTKMAIVLDSALAISQEPVFPLQRNRLYLRYKKTVKEYLWFSGDVKLDNYQKLHAYSLKDHHLGAREVVNLRFYASRQYKAFQDEAEIYFDAEYIYSPRVSKLLFVKNGKWQVLEECPHPGIVQIQSNEKNLEITSYKTPLKSGRAIFPATEGFYSFAFSAPDQLPYVDAGNLKRGGALVLDVKFPVLDSSAATPVEFSVKKDQIKALKNLEETEALYDTFTAEVDKNVSKIDTTAFSNVYPLIKSADTLGLVDSSVDYRGYVAHYNLKRSTAQKMWRERKLGEVSNIYKAFRAKLDSLQKLPLQLNLMPDSVAKIYPTIKVVKTDSIKVDSAKVDSVKADSATVDSATVDSAKADTVKVDSVKVDSLKTDSVKVDSVKVDSLKTDSVKVDSVKTDSSKVDTVKADTAMPAPVVTEYFKIDSSKVDSLWLRFAADSGRIDVAWKGVVEGISMETLAGLIAAKSDSLVVTLSLVNNKPVWAYKEGELAGRYQYRYEKVSFRIGDKLYTGKGVFVLPKHIALESEVRNWLVSKTAVSSSSVASSSSKATKKNGKIIEHATRGTVAVIDSGSFRYRGKVVTMSPFAIHTTEVTQEFFKKIMDRLDSAKRIPDRSAFKGPKKPVQGITWEKAQYACKVLGGDLPTEAQWEYAGRAGKNEGFLWASDDVMSVHKYAVFAGNSLKMGKKDTAAYGPHNVATKLPNAWGLYDMSGNVAEWTRDNYFAFTFSIESSNPTGSSWGTDKVLKGGSWKDKVKKLYMTERDDEDPRYWADWIGFRCAFPLDKIIQDNK